MTRRAAPRGAPVIPSEAKDLQKVHDDYIHKIDELIKAKEAEIMEV